MHVARKLLLHGEQRQQEHIGEPLDVRGATGVLQRLPDIAQLAAAAAALAALLEIRRRRAEGGAHHEEPLLRPQPSRRLPLARRQYAAQPEERIRREGAARVG